MSAPQLSRRDLYACAFLAFATILLYSRTFQADFVVLDDALYVNMNPAVQAGLKWATIKWAFTSGYAANWHPLTWISHMTDCSVYGLNPSKHHQINVIFHASNTALLFLALRMLTGNFWRCAIVAALFGWHPLHVESVAWIAERKDVLSTFFWMLTALAYANYAQKSGWWRYALVTFLFVLALLSKPMVVTLPFVLLLLDFWPLKRIRNWNFDAAGREIIESKTSSITFTQAFVEKSPWFALSAVCSFVTYKVQSASGMTTLLRVPFSTRATHVFISYCAYLGKIFWPSRLCAFYPYNLSPAPWEIFGAAAIVIAITFVAIVLRRRMPYILFGWLFFLGTLVPVIGIIQVGEQSVADRYSYVPSIGIFIAVIWAVSEFCVKRPALTSPAALSAAGILAVCMIATWKQEGYWHDFKKLFARAVAVTSNNAVAEYNYGYAFEREDDLTNALVHYRESARIDPTYYAAEMGIGDCLAKENKIKEALDHYAKTLRLNPRYWKGHYNCGACLQLLGDADGAINEYREAVRLEPHDSKCWFELGKLLLTKKQFVQGKTALENAIRLMPRVANIRSTYAMVLKEMNQPEAAIRQYEAAITLDPNDIISLNNLAWIFATSSRDDLRNGAEAVQLAQRACSLSEKRQPFLLGTLAAAYAESGAFSNAVVTAIESRDLAAALGKTGLSRQNDQLLKFYQAGKPFHESAPLP